MNKKLEQHSVVYKKAIGAILLKEFPRQTGLTVTDVLIDQSGKTGRVWLATSAEMLQEVEKRRSDIQKQLVSHVMTRYTPKFSFLLDDKYLDRMDSLFVEIDNSKLRHED